MKITKANLDSMTDRINEATGSPKESYTKTASGYRANPGNYHIEWAYGGCQLARMCNEGGGISNITSGFDTKANLYYQMSAYLNGIREGKS